MASAFRILGEGQLSLTKFLHRHRPAGRPEGLPRDARAPAGAHASRDRSLRVLEPVDGHARLHRARGQQGLQGRVARPRRSGPRAAGRVPSRRRRRPPTSPTCASSAAAVSSSAAAAMPRTRTPPRAWPRHPAFAGWPLLVLTDEPARAARSPVNFLWTTFTRFEPARDIHAAADRARPASRDLHAAGRHRRAAEARVPGRAVLRARRGRHRDAPMEGVLPVRRGDGRLGDERIWTESAASLSR